MEEEHHHYVGVTTTNNNNNPSAMADLRQFFSPIPSHHFSTPGHHLFSVAGAPLPHHYENMMLVHDFPQNTSSAGGFEMENAAGGTAGGFGLGIDGGATARWPRQETLTLLEIRSRLDHKFKEANHKGPLWDEVSRIMCEEHGYQRSGKKCREKFENLYKYYKKTKEGKAGRQDGKHYRFFRQLEALYGESTQHQHQHQIPISDHSHLNNVVFQLQGSTVNHQEGFQSMSLSNTSSDFDTSSSERVGSVDINGDSHMGRSRKRRGGGRSWKAKIKEFVDSQMRRIMEKQEAWLEKMMNTLESKEKERMLREEEWRKQESLRIDREHKLWAKERAWIEARDKALMDALQRITTGKEKKEDEDGKLLELRGSMQARFDDCNGGIEEGEIWKEISGRMACLGHDTSPKMCKEKWDFINKKRKENCSSRSNQYQLQLQTGSNGYGYGSMNCQGGMGLASTHTRLGEVNSMTDSCLRILLGDEVEANACWDHSYGVKLNKGD